MPQHLVGSRGTGGRHNAWRASVGRPKRRRSRRPRCGRGCATASTCRGWNSGRPRRGPWSSTRCSSLPCSSSSRSCSASSGATRSSSSRSRFPKLLRFKALRPRSRRTAYGTACATSRRRPTRRRSRSPRSPMRARSSSPSPIPASPSNRWSSTSAACSTPTRRGSPARSSAPTPPAPARGCGFACASSATASTWSICRRWASDPNATILPRRRRAFCPCSTPSSPSPRPRRTSPSGRPCWQEG